MLQWLERDNEGGPARGAIQHSTNKRLGVGDEIQALNILSAVVVLTAFVLHPTTTPRTITIVIAYLRSTVIQAVGEDSFGRTRRFATSVVRHEKSKHNRAL